MQKPDASGEVEFENASCTTDPGASIKNLRAFGNYENGLSISRLTLLACTAGMSFVTDIWWMDFGKLNWGSLSMWSCIHRADGKGEKDDSGRGWDKRN